MCTTAIFYQVRNFMRIPIFNTILSKFKINMIIISTIFLNPIETQADVLQKKWEYFCINVGEHAEAAETSKMLNIYGADGWEIASLAWGPQLGYRPPWYIYCFKRPFIMREKVVTHNKPVLKDAKLVVFDLQPENTDKYDFTNASFLESNIYQLSKLVGTTIYIQFVSGGSVFAVLLGINHEALYIQKHDGFESHVEPKEIETILIAKVSHLQK